MIRKIRNWVITAAFILGGTTVAMAQAKIAHIDSQKLLKEMPDMKKAQAELQKVEQSYTNDIQASIKEYQKKLEVFQQKVNALTEAQLKEKQAELEKEQRNLETMQNNIRQAQQTAAEEYQKKSQALIEPIMEKAKKAVQKVAKTQGYQYVLDSAAGAGVIVSDGKDLFNDVKKELGF